MKINQVIPQINTSSKKNKINVKPELSVNFNGAAIPVKSNFFKPLSNLYNVFTDFLAKGFGKVLDTDFAEKIITKTKNSEHWNKHLVSHLITTQSIILSSLYVKRTLSNEKLDEQKRKTLAINQASVWGVSTILGYTFTDFANKSIAKFIKKFKDVNVDDEKLAKYENGIKIAKSVIIFGIVYRYIAPVIVTPIANYIGNRIQEKKPKTQKEIHD